MRRVAAAVAASVVALLLAAGPAASQHGADPGGRQADASLAFNSVAPRHIDVLVGDTVKWTNDSVRTHTVTADDGSFDSGRFGIGGTYTRLFDATGDCAYHCVLHPSIRGDVAVHRLLLSAPATPADPGPRLPADGPRGPRRRRAGDDRGRPRRGLPPRRHGDARRRRHVRRVRACRPRARPTAPSPAARRARR